MRQCMRRNNVEIAILPIPIDIETPEDYLDTHYDTFSYQMNKHTILNIETYLDNALD